MDLAPLRLKRVALGIEVVVWSFAVSALPTTTPLHIRWLLAIVVVTHGWSVTARIAGKMAHSAWWQTFWTRLSCAAVPFLVVGTFLFAAMVVRDTHRGDGAWNAFVLNMVWWLSVLFFISCVVAVVVLLVRTCMRDEQIKHDWLRFRAPSIFPSSMQTISV